MAEPGPEHIVVHSHRHDAEAGIAHLHREVPGLGGVKFESEGKTRGEAPTVRVYVDVPRQPDEAWDVCLERAATLFAMARESARRAVPNGNI